MSGMTARAGVSRILVIEYDDKYRTFFTIKEKAWRLKMHPPPSPLYYLPTVLRANQSVFPARIISQQI
jgi:hypothetical protein